MSFKSRIVVKMEPEDSDVSKSDSDTLLKRTDPSSNENQSSERELRSLRKKVTEQTKQKSTRRKKKKNSSQQSLDKFESEEIGEGKTESSEKKKKKKRRKTKKNKSLFAKSSKEDSADGVTDKSNAEEEEEEEVFYTKKHRTKSSSKFKSTRAKIRAKPVKEAPTSSSISEDDDNKTANTPTCSMSNKNILKLQPSISSSERKRKYNSGFTKEITVKKKFSNDDSETSNNEENEDEVVLSKKKSSAKTTRRMTRKKSSREDPYSKSDDNEDEYTEREKKHNLSFTKDIKAEKKSSNNDKSPIPRTLNETFTSNEDEDVNSKMKVKGTKTRHMVQRKFSKEDISSISDYDNEGGGIERKKHNLSFTKDSKAKKKSSNTDKSPIQQTLNEPLTSNEDENVNSEMKVKGKTTRHMVQRKFSKEDISSISDDDHDGGGSERRQTRMLSFRKDSKAKMSSNNANPSNQRPLNENITSNTEEDEDEVMNSKKKTKSKTSRLMLQRTPSRENPPSTPVDDNMDENNTSSTDQSSPHSVANKSVSKLQPIVTSTQRKSKHNLSFTKDSKAKKKSSSDDSELPSPQALKEISTPYTEEREDKVGNSAKRDKSEYSVRLRTLETIVPNMSPREISSDRASMLDDNTLENTATTERTLTNRSEKNISEEPLTMTGAERRKTRNISFANSGNANNKTSSETHTSNTEEDEDAVLGRKKNQKKTSPNFKTTPSTFRNKTPQKGGSIPDEANITRNTLDDISMIDLVSDDSFTMPTMTSTGRKKKGNLVVAKKAEIKKKSSSEDEPPAQQTLNETFTAEDSMTTALKEFKFQTTANNWTNPQQHTFSSVDIPTENGARETYHLEQSVSDIKSLKELDDVKPKRSSIGKRITSQKKRSPTIQLSTLVKVKTKLKKPRLSKELLQNVLDVSKKNVTFNDSISTSSVKFKPTKMPNFAKIHQKQLDKSESLIDFVQRTHDRAQSLLSGTKRNYLKGTPTKYMTKKQLNFSQSSKDSVENKTKSISRSNAVDYVNSPTPQKKKVSYSSDVILPSKSPKVFAKTPKKSFIPESPIDSPKVKSPKTYITPSRLYKTPTKSTSSTRIPLKSPGPSSKADKTTKTAKTPKDKSPKRSPKSARVVLVRSPKSPVQKVLPVKIFDRPSTSKHGAIPKKILREVPSTSGLNKPKMSPKPSSSKSQPENVHSKIPISRAGQSSKVKSASNVGSKESTKENVPVKVNKKREVPNKVFKTRLNKEELKVAANKSRVIKAEDPSEKRKVFMSVRTNRRFDLLMQMRKK